jgi:phage terminase small subunit
MKKKPTPKAPSKATKGKQTATKQGTSKQAAADRRKVFVEAYIANGGNATEAAKTAGYSNKTARQQAARLLSDVAIKAAISSRAAAVANKYELTTELAARSIVQELSFDPAKLYREDGSLKSILELDEDTRMALTSVEFEQMGSEDGPVYVRKIKWASRASARDHLMKHLGMFEADNRQKGAALADILNSLDGKDTGLPGSR